MENNGNYNMAEVRKMRYETGDTKFYGFTSDVGGAGTSSAAVVFSRIASALWGKRILVVSFDGISRKMAPVRNRGSYAKGLFVTLRSDQTGKEIPEEYLCRDEFGVAYVTDAGFFNPLSELSAEDLYFCMNRIALSGQFDAVVLDYPFQSLRSVEISSLCEKIVVCCGRNCTGKTDRQTFRENFLKYAEEMPEKPLLHFFNPDEDRESFAEDIVDIHGQFGAEVRELAAELLEM